MTAPEILLARALNRMDVPAEASTQSLPEWDSFAHLNFMLALEQEFGIALTSRSIAACRSLKDACAYLREQGKSW